mmetsp:Transcript_45439/g.119353  ORF Transcript_45439/g.119353 Transcript_45439/m.119353 type:complete len:345 (+) Transcript_45439:1019-2053(+)
MVGEGRVARVARVATVSLSGDAHGVARELASLSVVKGATGSAGGGEAARALAEAMQVLPDLAPHAVSADEHVRIRLRPIGERGDDAAPISEFLVRLNAGGDAHGTLREAVLHEDLLDDGTVDYYRRRQTRLQRRPDCVETHQPVSAIVDTSKLVALAVANLEPRYAVGGARARFDELLVALRVDTLDRTQRVRLNLDRATVRRVRGSLLEDGDFHALGMARCRCHQAGEATAGNKDAQGLVGSNHTTARGCVDARTPPCRRVLVVDQHAFECSSILSGLIEAAADAMGAVIGFGLALRRRWLCEDLTHVIWHIDLVRCRGMTLSKPLELRKLALEFPEELRRAN